jgi:hypothetical protein
VHVQPLSNDYMILHSTFSVQVSMAHCCEQGAVSLVLTEGEKFTDKLSGC